ncbi:hypothetical protein FZEAL_8824 [Fusarium zealandicum]|uniref:Uncharacterized protein n=1 Tax=Fusarium zealandicum TaxID=1053134 RepID=A0A8H4UD44_9HYPO|nr:hypothetical protein FZEAL_8824 [Fusarium zealandicum]
MWPRSEHDLWVLWSTASQSSKNDRTEHHDSGKESMEQTGTMRWPCNHNWGNWACDKWVNTMGSKCEDCKSRKDMDSIPTHTRLAHMYDVDVIVEGFRNAGLNVACIVEMLDHGTSEQVLYDALKVVQDNDAEWHERVEQTVLQGIRRWKELKAA